jgi:threonine/homoserine/homoserine lactone efflux protein
MHSVTTSLIAFTAAASLLTITPGLDTALVLRTAATEGPRRAALAGLGIVIGCFCWAGAVAMGLGALLAASQFAYTVLRIVGAAYLVWLGYQMLRHPRRAVTMGVTDSGGLRASFARGLLTNLLNPKVGIFYVSFLPQFVPEGSPVAAYILLLGAIHAGLGLVWFVCLISATHPLARFLSRPAVVQTMDRMTGGLFLLFGAGLALESRRSFG